jgi:hypothetical protein
MNTTRIDSLLKAWEILLTTGKDMALAKVAKRLEKDPDARIKRTDNPPIVFDHRFHAEQKSVQELLTQQFPEHIDLINSVPAITGYSWKITDYIDLYFSHFYLVIQKLKEVVHTE